MGVSFKDWQKSLFLFLAIFSTIFITYFDFRFGYPAKDQILFLIELPNIYQKNNWLLEILAFSKGTKNFIETSLLFRPMNHIFTYLNLILFEYSSLLTGLINFGYISFGLWALFRNSLKSQFVSLILICFLLTNSELTGVFYMKEFTFYSIGFGLFFANISKIKKLKSFNYIALILSLLFLETFFVTTLLLCFLSFLSKTNKISRNNTYPVLLFVIIPYITHFTLNSQHSFSIMSEVIDLNKVLSIPFNYLFILSDATIKALLSSTNIRLNYNELVNLNLTQFFLFLAGLFLHTPLFLYFKRYISKIKKSRNVYTFETAVIIYPYIHLLVYCIGRGFFRNIWYIIHNSSYIYFLPIACWTYISGNILIKKKQPMRSFLVLILIILIPFQGYNLNESNQDALSKQPVNSLGEFQKILNQIDFKKSCFVGNEIIENGKPIRQSPFFSPPAKIHVVIGALIANKERQCGQNDARVKRILMKEKSDLIIHRVSGNFDIAPLTFPNFPYYHKFYLPYCFHFIDTLKVSRLKNFALMRIQDFSNLFLTINLCSEYEANTLKTKRVNKQRIEITNPSIIAKALEQVMRLRDHPAYRYKYESLKFETSVIRMNNFFKNIKYYEQ